MILAAGKGTRVRPITHTIPKPLIPILQKPVMEFLLELLRQHGFDQIMVNVSHLAEEIESKGRLSPGLAGAKSSPKPSRIRVQLGRRE